MIPFTLGALLAATLTLPAFTRLIRQRDAARVRGERRERFLLDELDASIAECDKHRNRARRYQQDKRNLQDRIAQLEAEALTKAPNWGAAPAEWRAS